MSLPLFPENILVSEDKVQDWLDTFPNLSAATLRHEAYRKAHNVEYKIRKEICRERSSIERQLPECLNQTNRQSMRASAKFKNRFELRGLQYGTCM